MLKSYSDTNHQKNGSVSNGQKTMKAAWSELMFLRCKNSPAAKLAPSSRWSWEAIKKEAIGRKEEDKT